MMGSSGSASPACDPFSVLYSSLALGRLTAVINGEPPTARTMPAPGLPDEPGGEPTMAAGIDVENRIGAGWNDIRATLQLRHTPEWQAWNSFLGKPRKQGELAAHLDEWGHTLVKVPIEWHQRTGAASADD